MMFSKRLLRLLLLAFTLILVHQSCELDDLMGDEDDPNYVSKQDAEKAAENLLFPDIDPTDTSTIILFKDDYNTRKFVSTIDEISGRGNKNLFYIVNYADSGFAIIAADKRIQPVLAYSKYNAFPLESKTSLPPALAHWLEDYATMIANIRKEDIKAPDRTSLMWERVLDMQINIDFLEMFECDDGSIDFGEYVEKKILLDTKWSQGCYFNAALSDSCQQNHWWLCNRPPVGCVATAIGQILKYHADGSWSGAYMTNGSGGNQGNPKLLDWENMPLSMHPSFSHNPGDIPELMEDLGIFLSMGYGCDGSGTNYKKAYETITEDFNFSGIKKDLTSASDYSTVISDIKNNLPVYMRGNEEKKEENLEGEIEVSYPGHGWVADGYAQYHDCRVGFRENDYQIHMNWGWGGNHDGQYMKKEGRYDENRQIIHGISP